MKIQTCPPKDPSPLKVVFSDLKPGDPFIWTAERHSIEEKLKVKSDTRGWLELEIGRTNVGKVEPNNQVLRVDCKISVYRQE